MLKYTYKLNCHYSDPIIPQNCSNTVHYQILSFTEMTDTITISRITLFVLIHYNNLPRKSLNYMFSHFCTSQCHSDDLLMFQIMTILCILWMK